MGLDQLVGAEFFPEGFALAQSILPIFDDVDRLSARSMGDVMVAGFPSSNTGSNIGSYDFDKVRQAVENALSKIGGVDCAQIGSLDGKGFCPGDVKSQAPPSSTLLVALAAVGLLLFTLY